MRFALLALTLAAAAAPAATITLAPGASFSGLLDMTAFYAPPVPDWNYSKQEVYLFIATAPQRKSPSVAVRASSDELYMLAADDWIGDLQFSAAVNTVPAVYHFTAWNADTVAASIFFQAASVAPAVHNPEPASWLLMAGGLGVLLAQRRRKS